MKVLNLSHNKIRKLDSNTFRGMRFLRRLYLSDNQINDVGRGTFGSVTRIGTIDLSRNFIKKIDFQMFNQLQFAEVYIYTLILENYIHTCFHHFSSIIYLLLASRCFREFRDDRGKISVQRYLLGKSESVS